MKCIIKFIISIFKSEKKTQTFDIDENNNWILAEEILVLINEYRDSVGLSSIKIDKTAVSQYALEHSKYMLSVNKISHDNYSSRSKALHESGAVSVGENVAYGYTNAEDVVKSWILSPTHKRVIEGNFTHSGIGIIAKENGMYFITQLFYR